MASIYARGPRFWVKFRDPLSGKIKRTSLGPEVTTRVDALAIARSLEIRSAHEEALPESVSVGTALSRFLDDKAPPLRAQWTHETYLKHASHFRRLLPCDLALARLTSAHIKHYRDSRVREGVKPQTVNKERTTLATFWRWAQRDNDPPLAPHDRNPVAAVKPLEVRGEEAEPCPEPIFREAVAELRRDADDPARAGPDRYRCALYADVLEFAWWTGLRAGEVCALRADSVRLADGEMSVYSAWNKGPAPSYPIPLEARAILSKRIALGHEWVFATESGKGAYRTLYKFWSVWAREKPHRTRFRAAHIHALRHAYTTALDRAGVAESVLMKLTRHRTPRVRLRYTHRDLEDMRAAQTALGKARLPQSGPPAASPPPSGGSTGA